MTQDESRSGTSREGREAAAARAGIAVRPDEFQQRSGTAGKEDVFQLRGIDVHYDGVAAVKGISMDVGHKDITALIGPSGCGKSTLLRCLNRMNDLIPD